MSGAADAGQLRVTMVTFDDAPPLGGQGVVVRGLRAALRDAGVEVSTVAGRGDGAVPFARVTGRPPLDFSIAMSRRPRLMTAADPQVLNVHGGPGGVLLLRRPGVPAVYTAHHTYRQAFARRRPQRVLSPLEARAYRRAARVLPVSASTAAAVRALGVPAGRIEVVPPGVDRAPVADGSLREPGRVLFAGRLEREKGPLDAVLAMAALAELEPGVRGVVVGTGRLDARVAAAAAATRGAVEVLGHVSDEELWRQYARADLVLLPSRFEGLGLVALQCAAAGAVPVGYDVEGLRDSMASVGIRVPALSVRALVEACLGLLRDRPHRDALARHGQDFVAEHHTWERMAARTAEILREAAAAG